VVCVPSSESILAAEKCAYYISSRHITSSMAQTTLDLLWTCTEVVQQIEPMQFERNELVYLRHVNEHSCYYYYYYHY